MRDRLKTCLSDNTASKRGPPSELDRRSGAPRRGWVILLALHPAAGLDRTAAARDALTGAAAATLLSGLVISEADLVTGPTGRARKFLMRQRHRAQTARV